MIVNARLLWIYAYDNQQLQFFTEKTWKHVPVHLQLHGLKPIFESTTSETKFVFQGSGQRASIPAMPNLLENRLAPTERYHTPKQWSTSQHLNLTPLAVFVTFFAECSDDQILMCLKSGGGLQGEKWVLSRHDGVKSCTDYKYFHHLWR